MSKKLRTDAYLKAKEFDTGVIEDNIEPLISELDLKNRAYSKIGLPEESLALLAPLKIIGFDFGEKMNDPAEIKVFKSGNTISSNISCTYILFGKTQIYVDNYIFTNDFKYRQENFAEIFYRDISSVCVKGKYINVIDKNKQEMKVAVNYMSITFGAEKIEFPVLPDFDINNEKLFEMRKLIRMKKNG